MVPHFLIHLLLALDINHNLLKNSFLLLLLKVLEKVSSKKEYNKSILEEIFNTKMITLENVHIVLSQEDEKIIVKYYDGNVLETKKDFSIKENDIKLRKKIKLFV